MKGIPMAERKDLEERTKKRLDGMSLDEKSLWISKLLMQVEWALESACPDVDALRADDRGEEAMASMMTLQSYHEIRAAHMRLTRVDAMVNERDIPLAESR